MRTAIDELMEFEVELGSTNPFADGKPGVTPERVPGLWAVVSPLMGRTNHTYVDAICSSLSEASRIASTVRGGSVVPALRGMTPDCGESVL